MNIVINVVMMAGLEDRQVVEIQLSFAESQDLHLRSILRCLPKHLCHNYFINHLVLLLRLLQCLSLFWKLVLLGLSRPKAR